MVKYVLLDTEYPNKNSDMNTPLPHTLHFYVSL